MADPPEVVPAAVPAVVPPTFTIDAFDRHKMKWSRWVERLESAFVLFGVQDGVKLHMLLHYMGGETYDILCDKLAPERPSQKTYAQLVETLQTHFNPEPLEILENFDNRRVPDCAPEARDHLQLRELPQHGLAESIRVRVEGPGNSVSPAGGAGPDFAACPGDCSFDGAVQQGRTGDPGEARKSRC